MNTSDGKNVEKLGATTEALAQGNEKVQTDAEAGPVETDSNDNVVDGQDVSDAQPSAYTETRTTETTSSAVTGRRNPDLATEASAEDEGQVIGRRNEDLPTDATDQSDDGGGSSDSSSSSDS